MELFTRGGISRRALLQQRMKERYLQSDISKYIAHIIFSTLVGLFAGAGAILFHSLLERMRRVFEFIHGSLFTSTDINLIFIVPVIGGLCVAAMTRAFPDIAAERDVISVIKAVILRGGFIPLKNTVFHLIAPIISIGSGAPLGPEGPAAKVGSGAGSLVAQVVRMNRRDMKMYTVAGAGAAISAVFNAPIAGVFFGIEVILLNDLKNQALSALIISSVVADVLSRWILGARHVFLIPQYVSGTIGDIPYFLALGILCGVISLAYFRLRRFFKWVIDSRYGGKNEFVRLIPVTIVFGLVLLKYQQLYGIGYTTINQVLNHQFLLSTVFMLLLLKLVFLALFLEAGSFGGTFAPALMLGVLLGYAFAVSLNGMFNATLDPVSFALVGMGGVLAGINSIPLTSILLVFEVTGDYRFILPLMFVSIISYLAVTYVNRGNVYTLHLLDDGIDITKRGELDLLGKINVGDLKKTDYDVVSHNTPYRGLLEVLKNSTYGDVFVVNKKNEIQGVISLKDIREALISHDLVDLLIAGDMVATVPVVTEDEPVSSAMRKIEMYDLETIPVVKSVESPVITGVLTYRDVIQAYNKMLATWETDQFLINYEHRKRG